MNSKMKALAAALAVAVSGLINAQTETLLIDNHLEFTGLNDQTAYELKLRMPAGKLKTLYLNPSQNITFEASDFAMNQFPDGTYKYELFPFQATKNKTRTTTEKNKNISEQNLETISGTFTVVQGKSVVDQDEVTRDQVIADDLVLQGSACIGQDCTNGESFGFDTLRLKENNLRIRFMDTSTSSSFPTNDWELTANDSANGGANRFSITDIDGGRTPFTVEAGARNNALYVDNGGRVGFGTNNPIVEAHVVDGDTPTLRLEQNGSNGWNPQTWDVAGNEANFFIRDVTNSSSLLFRIQPGAPSNSIYIKTGGNVGL